MVGERGFEPPTPWSRTRKLPYRVIALQLSTRPKAEFSRATAGGEAREFSAELLVETGPSIIRSEKRHILGPDFGCWRNSLVEEILGKGPNSGVFL